MPTTDQTWILKHWVAISAFTVQVLALGILWGQTQSAIASNGNRIKALEEIKADQTSWLVSQHDKRLDGHDQSLMRITERLDRMTVMIERIDQKISSNSNQK